MENISQISDKINLKIQALKIVQGFFKKDSVDDEIGFYKNSIVPKPQDEMPRILNVLHSFLYQPFPGLECTAKEVGISSRSLVEKFKKDHGISVFQYFRKKQLELARKKFESEDVLVKNLAHSFGYNNVSKFFAAFKKEFGLSPSEVQSNR